MSLAKIAYRKRLEQQAARYTVTAFQREGSYASDSKLRCLAEGCRVLVEVGGRGYCRAHWRLARGKP